MIWYKASVEENMWKGRIFQFIAIIIVLFCLNVCVWAWGDVYDVYMYFEIGKYGATGA